MELDGLDGKHFLNCVRDVLFQAPGNEALFQRSGGGEGHGNHVKTAMSKLRSQSCSIPCSVPSFNWQPWCSTWEEQACFALVYVFVAVDCDWDSPPMTGPEQWTGCFRGGRKWWLLTCDERIEVVARLSSKMTRTRLCWWPYTFSEPSRAGGVKLTHHLTLQLPQNCNNSQ